MEELDNISGRQIYYANECGLTEIRRAWNRGEMHVSDDLWGDIFFATRTRVYVDVMYETEELWKD